MYALCKYIQSTFIYQAKHVNYFDILLNLTVDMVKITDIRLQFSSIKITYQSLPIR